MHNHCERLQNTTNMADIAYNLIILCFASSLEQVIKPFPSICIQLLINIVHFFKCLPTLVFPVHNDVGNQDKVVNNRWNCKQAENHPVPSTLHSVHHQIAQHTRSATMWSDRYAFIKEKLDKLHVQTFFRLFLVKTLNLRRENMKFFKRIHNKADDWLNMVNPSRNARSSIRMIVIDKLIPNTSLWMRKQSKLSNSKFTTHKYVMICQRTLIESMNSWYDVVCIHILRVLNVVGPLCVLLGQTNLHALPAAP